MIYVYILVMAGVTYLIRMLPLTLFQKKIENRFVRSFLYYVPYACLSAMTLPAILYSASSIIAAAAGLVVALVLINLEEKGEKKINLKWGIYVILAFAGNGMCSTVQKMQQTVFQGQYKNEFMIAALIMSAVAIGIFALITEKKQVLPNLKAGFWLYLICGLANGLANFFVVYLSLRVAASVMFPVISAGGIVLTFLVSLFFYKEKLSKWQILGSALGLVSVIFLNL